VALIPAANAPKKPIEGLTVVPVTRVEDAMAWARQAAQ
jgi:DNA repair protein RadA/Sms